MHTSNQLLKTAYPHIITRDCQWIGKKDKYTSQQSHIPYIHSRTAKNLFSQDNCKSHCNSKYPKWNIRWHYQRYQSSCDKKPLFDAFTFLRSK